MMGVRRMGVELEHEITLGLMGVIKILYMLLYKVLQEALEGLKLPTI